MKDKAPNDKIYMNLDLCPKLSAIFFNTYLRYKLIINVTTKTKNNMANIMENRWIVNKINDQIRNKDK